MLNHQGGFVLFGVSDKGELVGQQVSAKTLTEIANELARIDPPAFPDIDTIALNNNHQVIVISVSRGKSYPYSYDGRPYQRVGATMRVMLKTVYEQTLLERLHTLHRWENEPVAKGITIKDLDAEEIQLTVDNAISLGRLDPIKNRKLPVILNGLGLIKDEQLLNAAVVLYGKSHLQSDYPQCEIKLARFRGIDRLGDFADNRQYWANAFELLRKAETFLMNHVPIASRIVANKFIREDRPLYSPPATREALANAICHRDYSIIGGSIGVAMYDDHLEIINPGSLHFSLTPKALRKPHESRPWNPIIAMVFYRAGIIEKWGRGTINIIDRCKEIEAPIPKWTERTGHTIVTFYPAKLFADPSEAPSGQVIGQVTGQVVGQVTGQVVGQVTRQVAHQFIQKVLVFCKEPRKASEIQKLLQLKHRENFQNNYLKPLLDAGLIAMKFPDKPRSSLQQYCLTEKGKKWLVEQII